MKILSDKPIPSSPTGKRKVIVELNADESLHAFTEDDHYQLGSPMDDQVISGRILRDAQRVHWDSLEQKWM